ncbi:MAG: NAD(P)H-dependent oxidoreductase [Marinobacter sp.]|nr:NAD(P)H-dependent oxidoreductase [Marinobacter sp.]
MALTLNIVTCSTRPGRIGPSIAQWFLEYAREHSAFDCRLVDLVDFELPVYNEANHPQKRDLRTRTYPPLGRQRKQR